MIVATLLAALALAGGGDPSGPARVQVSADEFSFALSRLTIPRGPLLLELVNFGEDDHDLALRRAGRGSRTHRLGEVRPGRRGELEARLVPGRYRLWCTLPGHRAAGMTAMLVVRRSATPPQSGRRRSTTPP